MKTRRFIALGATTIAAVTALFAAPAFASSSSTYSIHATHTLHFTAVAVASHPFSRTTAVVVDKDVHNGKVIAYNELDLTGNRAAVALGLNHGFLYGNFVINVHTGSFSGKVTGGTGAYKGVTGTISGHAVSAKKAAVTVTYH